MMNMSTVMDTGGAVAPKLTCPHVFLSFHPRTHIESAAESAAESEAEEGSEGSELQRQLSACFSCSCLECLDGKSPENWICMRCYKTLCSRYVAGHCEGHFFETTFQDANDSHCLVLSCQDLSVWCYQCNQYVKHDRLIPTLMIAESVKFHEPPKRHLLNGVKQKFNVGFAYPEDVSSLHAHPRNQCYERPRRTAAIFERLEEQGLLTKLRTLPNQCVEPPSAQLMLALSRVHEETYINKILESSRTDSVGAARREELNAQPDVFATTETASCALAAVGAAMDLCDLICTKEIDSGFALIRPPGHHADRNSAGGFCFFNNVAVAAQHAVSAHQLRRVMVIDFDIHHGNGCQSIFYDRNDVLHVSIHRQWHGEIVDDNGHSEMASYGDEGLETYIGTAAGVGYNVNVPLPAGTPGVGMEDADYIAVWNNIVSLLVNEFSPELIIVAAGYDAGRGDIDLPVGGYSVSESIFKAMIGSLRSYCLRTTLPSSSAIESAVQTTTECSAGLMLCLEGGYNLGGLADSAVASIEALLDDGNTSGDGSLRIIDTEAQSCSPETSECIERVRNTLRPYWRSFSSA